LGQGDPFKTGGVLLPEQAAYDVTFYELDMQIFPEQQSINAAVTVVADVHDTLEKFVLDLDPVFVIDAVELLEGDTIQKLSFEKNDARLWSSLPEARQPGEQLKIRVSYAGQPQVAANPPWQGGFNWSETGDGKYWIGVSCQGEGADIWWPCKDHPSDEPDSVALRFTVPKPYICVSNGRLEGVVDNQDGTLTYDWFVSTPINNYSVTLNIAPYESITGEYSSVAGEVFPVTLWILPEKQSKGQAFYEQMLAHLAFMEQVFGPYPFRADKYGVAFTAYLGMEHQTIISYGDDFENNSFGFDWIHLHELAHEWWGNLASAADWKDIGLHEGFATYAEALYAEHLGGADFYHSYLSRMKTENLYPVAPLDSRDLDSVYGLDVYRKGALILHSLRYLLGDQIFFTVLRRMLYPDPAIEEVSSGEQCRLVSNDDFVEITESYAGVELNWFFDLYLHQAALPELICNRNGSELLLRWQTPENLPFPMPVPVVIGGDTIRVEMSSGEASVDIVQHTFRVDPLNWILKSDNISGFASGNTIPRDFALYQNYPNPFNPATVIFYDLPGSSHVSLEVFNLAGQKTITLFDDLQNPGRHSVQWDGRDSAGVPVASGVYIYRLRTSQFQKSMKLQVLR
jgi:aminopeptidase N